MQEQVPGRKGHKLHQNLDVSSAARSPNDGDALVYDKTVGLWVPRSVQVSIEPGDLPENSIANIHMQDNAVNTRVIQNGSISASKMAALSVGTSNLIDSSTTDAKIGTRVIDDGVTVSTSTANNTGTITDLFSRFGSRIKAIIGGTSWRSAVPISLTQLASHRARHYTGGADPLTAANIGAAPTVHTHSAATTSAAGFMSTDDVVRLRDIGRSSVVTSTTTQSLTSGPVIVAGNVVIDRYGWWQILMVVQLDKGPSSQVDTTVSIELMTNTSSTPIKLYNTRYAALDYIPTWTGVYMFHRNTISGSQSFYIRAGATAGYSKTFAQIAATWTGAALPS